MLSANMYFSIQHEPYLSFMVSTSHLRGTLVSSIVKENDAIRRRRALKRVDRELYKGNFKSALSLVKHLQGKPGGLRGFGAAKQVSLCTYLFFIFCLVCWENVGQRREFLLKLFKFWREIDIIRNSGCVLVHDIGI